MDLKQVWKKPSQEDQYVLRKRLFDYLERLPTPCKKIARDADLSPITLNKFMGGKNLEWVSYKKLMILMDKIDKD